MREYDVENYRKKIQKNHFHANVQPNTKMP